ncbi:MAG: Flp pilus assembly protein CpaB [Alphaproteobacteria bacterium]|nr:Flp pilus assembly protein CpaB [Alphaproteobacteria bacterium]
MPTRKITLLLVAAIVAIGTIVVARGMMKPAKTAPEGQTVAVQTVEVAAAAHNIKTGTLLKASDFKWIPWAADSDNSALFVKGKTTLAALGGAVARDNINAGEPVTTGRVVQPHDQGFLAAVLKPGMRAMSITLSPSSDVSGFIFPGDRVDVILTHGFSRKGVAALTQRRISETILHDVRVLALDQRSDKDGNDPKLAKTATLEVSPRDAEKLALAVDMTSQMGPDRAELSLALRSLATGDKPGDRNPPPTWDSDVSRAFPSVDGSDGLTQRVQVMRGQTTTEDVFERHGDR